MARKKITQSPDIPKWVEQFADDFQHRYLTVRAYKEEEGYFTVDWADMHDDYFGRIKIKERPFKSFRERLAEAYEMAMAVRGEASYLDPNVFTCVKKSLKGELLWETTYSEKRAGIPDFTKIKHPIAGTDAIAEWNEEDDDDL